MTGERKTFYFRDNTGGCNLRSTEVNVNQGPQATEMVVIQNMDIYRPGGFDAQLGNTVLNTGITDNTAVLSMGQFRSGNNTYCVYRKASGKAYAILNTGGAEGSPIKTGLSTTGQGKFIEFNGHVIEFNGVDVPWEWNGTTAQTLTGNPSNWSTTKPTTAAVEGGKRIFAMAGTTVNFCALGNENDWTTASDAGSFTEAFNDTTNIINVTEYGQQVAFHTGKPSIYLLTGTDPTTYAIDPIASNRAAVSKLGTSVIDDYQYFFCGDSILPLITTDLGVVKLGKGFDISLKIKPFLTNTEPTLPVIASDSTYKNQVIMLPYDFKNQLLVYFKTIGNTVFDTCAIYNLDSNAWVFRVATPITCAARVGDYILTGTADGKILREFFGTTVVGGIFQKRILSPYFDFGVPDRQKQVIRFFIVFKSNTTLNVKFNLYSDYSTTIKYTQNITSQTITSSAYGSAIYGKSNYASTQVLDVALTDINLQGKAFSFELLSSDSTVDFHVLYYAFTIEFLDAF